MLRFLPLLLFAICSAAAESTLHEQVVALADGGTTPRLSLSNGEVAIAVLPALGGKIASLTGRNGREYLSRSDKPYRTRQPGTPFSDSEFDGIDECFPTVGACAYPAAPWAGLKIPDHGELWSQAWTRSAGPGLTLEATGITLPYRMRRSITLQGPTVTLDYTVTNTGDAPLQYLYAFHALLVGNTGCGVAWAETQPIVLSYSREGFLGASGTTLAWSDLHGPGKPLGDGQFVRDSGRYYKYFASPLATGQATAFLTGYMGPHDQAILMMTWPIADLPHVAVWCSEGNVGHHLGVEPTTAPVDTLAQAAAAGQARSIPAHGAVTWSITLSIVTPQPKP